MTKKPSDSFTTFRVLGKKAQQLLLKTTQELKQRREAAAAGLPPAEEQPPPPATVIRFSLMNVWQATLIVLLSFAGAYLVYLLWGKIFLLLLAFFVAAIMDPGVRALERYGIPRGFGILLHYVVALFVIIFLLVTLIPTVAQQLQLIAELLNANVNEFLAHPMIDLPFVSLEMNANLTQLVKNALQNLSINEFTDAVKSLGTDMQSILQGTATIAGKVGLTIVSFVVQATIVLAMAFFIQMERENLHMWARGFFRSSQRAYIDTKLDAVQMKISMWARGQLMLGCVIGILVYIALKILRIPNAETLALLAGFTEFIPYIGPFIAAIPAVLIALTQEQGGFVWAAIVAGVYYVIQWCENNLLVPLIMKRAVGVSPIAIIFAMMAGVTLPQIFQNPILGLLLAVPITTVLSVFLSDLRRGPPPAA